MFSSEDFEIPLEKQLKMRLVYDDIDSCTDRDALKENLKECVEQLVKYQHLLTLAIKKTIESELAGIVDFAELGIAEKKEAN
jgi:predicted DNA-binding protein YlxM (UPF0122 family)